MIWGTGNKHKDCTVSQSGIHFVSYCGAEHTPRPANWCGDICVLPIIHNSPFRPGLEGREGWSITEMGSHGIPAGTDVISERNEMRSPFLGFVSVDENEWGFFVSRHRVGISLLVYITSSMRRIRFSNFRAIFTNSHASQTHFRTRSKQK